jgi:hypothetical protein
MQVAADVDAARHGKQRGQQDHERDVLGQQRMHQIHASHRRTKDQANGNRNASPQPRPPCRNGGARKMGGQRHHRNRQQQAGKRHRPQRDNWLPSSSAAAARPGHKPASTSVNTQRFHFMSCLLILFWLAWQARPLTRCR